MTAARADFAPPFNPMLATTSTGTQRRLLIVAAVLGLHVAGLWALQSGLLRRAVELVIPVQILADLIEAPQPEVTPLPPAPPTEQARPTKPKPTQPKPVAAPAPQPVAIADTTPAPDAPTGVTAPDPAQIGRAHV